MTDHLKVLFDQMRQAEQHLADQEAPIEQARQLRNQARDALWVAIDAELDATTEETDLKESVRRLEALVLDLIARMPPPPRS